jgi:hypothetical protein
MHQRGQKPLPWRRGLKWVVSYCHRSHDAPGETNARTCLRLWKRLLRNSPLVWCWAAPSSTAKGIVPMIRHQFGTQSVIPAKLGNKTWRVRGSGRNAAGVSAAALHAALWSSPSSARRDARSGPAARFAFPSVPFETSLSFLKDVNRAET